MSSSSPLPTPTTTPLTFLRSVSSLLHLTFHRNKNQHRLAKWWSSFSQLRRQVQKLVKEMETLETAERYEVRPVAKKGKTERKREKEREKGDGNERGGGEGKYVVAAREKVRERVDSIEAWLVGGCYVAFTNLIADNQYAPLGLILMATLARTKRIIRPFGSALPPTPTSTTPPSTGPISTSVTSLQVSIPDEDSKFDLGEVVSRSKVDLNVELGEPIARTGAGKEVEGSMRSAEAVIEGLEEDAAEEEKARSKERKKKRKEVIDEEPAGLSAASSIPKPKRVKKKKKGGDAFDDLFSSLM